MEGRLPRPVLLAGLLGGAIGAVLSLALARAFPPVQPSAAPAAGQPSAPPDGRAFADDTVAKIRDGKDEELKGRIRLAYRDRPDADFEQKIWPAVLGVRKQFSETYGKSLGFELARENVVTQNVVRFTYIERYEHDCLVWSLVCYNGPKGWQVISFQNLTVDSAAQLLK